MRIISLVLGLFFIGCHFNAQPVVQNQTPGERVVPKSRIEDLEALRLSEHLFPDVKSVNTQDHMAISVLPLIYALHQFAKHTKGTYAEVNTEQAAILKLYEEYKDACEQPELQSIIKAKVSTDYTVLNEFLSKHGFSIQLSPFSPDTIGVAALTKAQFQWQHAGTQRELFLNSDKLVKGFILQRSVSYYKASAQDSETYVAVPETKNNIKVFLVHKQCRPKDEIELLQRALNVLKTMTPPGYRSFEGIRCPELKIGLAGSMGWLCGLRAHTHQGTFSCDQALQENKLCMDHLGGSVESAVAMGMSKGAPHYLVFDSPFIVVVTIDKLILCVFWIDPEKLEEVEKA